MAIHRLNKDSLSIEVLQGPFSILEGEIALRNKRLFIGQLVGIRSSFYYTEGLFILSV